MLHIRNWIVVKVIVPRGSWILLTELVKYLHRKYSSAAYVFRNNYFFLDLPSAPHETSNITFVKHRLKVGYHFSCPATMWNSYSNAKRCPSIRIIETKRDRAPVTAYCWTQIGNRRTFADSEFVMMPSDLWPGVGLQFRQFGYSCGPSATNGMF